MNSNRDGTSAHSSPLSHALNEKNRQQMLDALENPMRRRVLHDLDPDEGQVALSDLAERVANRHVRGASRFTSWSSDDDTASDHTAADQNATARTSGDRASTAGTSTARSFTDPADADPADADSIDRVALRLHHVHLPKLAEYGLVEYDHRDRVVTVKTRS